MRRIDWDALAPLGLGGRLTANRICIGLGASSAFAWIVFWTNLEACEGALAWFSGDRILCFQSPTGIMEPFYQILDHSLLCFGFVALCMLPLAAWHYCYHYQDSRSIYLMRRLPNRRELWRRCLGLPLLGVAACGVLSAAHVLVFYAIYHYAASPQCLQPGQWRMLWESLFH